MNRLSIFLSAVLFLFTSYVRGQEELVDVSIALPVVAAQPGEEICLDVTSDNFDGVFGLQLSIAFDPAALTFLEITNLNLPEAMLERDFNTTLAAQGKISMLWTNLGSAVYPKPITLFTLCFRVTGTAGQIVPVRFANDPVAVEVINNSGPLGEEFTQGLFSNGAVWIRSGALPPLPQIGAAPSVVSCEETWKAVLDISVSGGAPPYQYNWSGPNSFASTDEDLRAVPFGVYSLTVTDENSAPAFATFYLVKPQSLGPPAPIVAAVDATAAASCADPDGAISLNLNRDAASLSFQWSNGATTQNITGLQPGTYEVTVVDENGCTEIRSATVPLADDFAIVVSEQPAVCTQSPGRLEITSPAGAGYQYHWFNGSEASAVDNLPPGAYGLTVTESASGCAKTVQLEVTAQGEIPLTIEEVQPKCDGTPGRITLQLPDDLPMDIEWNSGDRTAQLTGLTPGFYQVTLTDQTAGCIRKELIIMQRPDVSVAQQTECRLSGSAPDSVSVTLTPTSGVGPFTFSWNNGETTVSNGSSTMAAPLPAVLFATVTDQEGCKGYSAPPVDCREEDQQEDFNTTLYYECEGEPFFTAYVREGGQPPYRFRWSTGFEETAEQSSTVPAPGFGFTSVTVTDAAGKTDILVGYPLLVDPCPDNGPQVELIVPDTIVEVDEPFALPILVNSEVDLDRLVFDLHWDARRLQLLDLSGQGLTLGASIQEINLSGKARMTFDLAGELPAGGRLATLQFTPKETMEEGVPILFGYSKWSAVRGPYGFFIRPMHGSVTIVPDGAKVWPGDTDASRQVDHRDLLNIGLAYGAAGTARANASTAWQGQYAPAWGQATPQSDVDYKYIDTNGDGVVQAADTAAIIRNWSLVTTHFREPVDGEPIPKINGAPLRVEGDIIATDQENMLPIVLGTAAQPAQGVYGLAFSVGYQGYISTQNIQVDFADSWLAQDGTPLLALYRHFPTERRIDIALVRTNGQSVSGFGPIAQLSLRGNNRTGSLQTGLVETLDAKMIDHQEQLLTVTLESTTLSVDYSTHTREPAWARHIALSPIPASGELLIQAEGIEVQGLQVLNLQGQVLAVYPAQRMIPVQGFVPGVYLLRIQTPLGIVARRWVKQGP